MKKRRTKKQILKQAVRTLYDYRFISQFEKDSFYTRIDTIKK